MYRSEQSLGANAIRKLASSFVEEFVEDIIAIVDEYFQAQINECDDMGELSNFEEAKDDLTSVLCDAVCRNFPAK